jgi:hypothetical protein
METPPPTVGNQQRNTLDFPQNNSPPVYSTVNRKQPRPRVGKPVAIPVAPLPTPHLEYSTPLGHQERPYSYVYATPVRSALKNRNSTGRTIF